MSLAVLLTTVVHALVYAGILLIILFRCIGVAQHPRFCFWFTAVSKFVLECLMGGIESMPAYVSSQQLPVLDSLLQAMSTLIFLVIVGVFGRGYLPRNFIKVTCYLYQINLVLIPFTYLAYRLTLPYPEDSWQYLLASICINLIAFAEVLAVSRLVNGWLDRLLRRISDRLCLIFFVLACLVYLGKELLMLRESGYVIIGSSAGILGGYFLGSILLLSLVLIVVLLFYGMKDYHRFHRIHRLENRMMLDYYTNVSGLYLGVRQLRHDLSNHLAAGGGQGAYRTALEHASETILERVSHQTGWQCIDTELLSSWEKDEIYHYMMDVLEAHGLPAEALEIRTGAGQEGVLSCVIHGADTQLGPDRQTGNLESRQFEPYGQTGEGLQPGNPGCTRGRGRARRKTMRLRRLRRNPMYGVIRTLAAHHGGTATWKKSGEDFALEIRLG